MTALHPCHQAAREYLALGCHPIPVQPREKKPLVEWKRYQTEAPLLDEIDAWWETWPDANVGLVLGRGAFAVDLDGDRDAEALLHAQGVYLPAAPVSRTANGFHVFLSAPGPVPDRVALLGGPKPKPQVDIRGVGFVVAPPSIHPTGAQYVWKLPLAWPLPAAPPALLELITRGRARMNGPAGSGWVAESLRGAGEGVRDATCTRLAGYLLGKGLDAPTVEALLIESFARNCTPPFPAHDVRKCVQSIARREGVTGAMDRPVTPVPLRQVLDDLRAQLAAGPSPSLRTPFPSLNHYLCGGLVGGELVYLGARPGVGKTALGLEFARTAAKAGTPVLMVSREMVNVALARRLVAQEGRVPAGALKSGRVEPRDAEALARALVRLQDLPIWLLDDAVSVGEVITAVTQPVAPFGLVIVDYLQLVRAPAEVRERRLQVEAVSQGLKTLALQCRLPVLCLSSLSRGPKDREEAPPTLASLRESGELEHDADIVLLLHRKRGMGETDCTVAKNRDGRTGLIKLHFEPIFVAFQEVTDREEDQEDG